MEFWGVEVKSGEPLKCDPGLDKYLHLSQASLGEVKKDKGNVSIPIFVKFGGQKLVLGTLSPEKCSHISFDLVFEKEFELSHNWKNGSVYFCGYKTIIPEDDTDYDSGDEYPLIENGKANVKDEQTKPAMDKASASKPESSAAKPKVKIVESNKTDKDKDEDDEDDDDDESGEDESDDEENMNESGDESDDEDDDESSDDDEEATPKKSVEMGKKRPVESATKVPVPEKKAKLVTPSGGQKTGGDGKKGGHTATPYPSKQVAKTQHNIDKSKQQTPKSSGQVSCKSCSRTFNSDQALESHTKAKHSAGK
eukprot:TRINITY_DN1962_c1_g2_i1.p1 TRINITY_DN1962_c1_g2~~TRINITY_DN1962_c1_g2_i1.p1  ORF type:complete len:326 (+),score=95.91 TRINITY_DN1962_c1_g2_i1:52-978(+)